ncbi:MAG TPA: DoxX family protein [Polyangia bacterium]|nr:DoxX family protein [Polyangia bacterium]
MKTKTTVYWICTALVALSFLSGGIANVLHVPQAVAGMIRLGYPLHFLTLLGVWKILGAGVILAPGLPLLKEWAYAGMIFDLTGASIAHAAVGDSDAWQSNTGHVLIPLALAALAIASWSLRPDSRKLIRTDVKTVAA